MVKITEETHPGLTAFIELARKVFIDTQDEHADEFERVLRDRLGVE